MTWIRRIEDEVRIGRLGSFPAGSLSFAFAGDVVTITDDIRGRPVLEMGYGDLLDGNGNPIGTPSEVFDYLTIVLAEPTTPDYLATYRAARDT